MRTIIAGTRTAGENDVQAAWGLFISACPVKPTVILSGAAAGADKHGERIARDAGIPVWTFPAKWSEHGKAAGPIRNAEMASRAEALLLVWDGSSRGSRDMLARSRSLGLFSRVFLYGSSPSHKATSHVSEILLNPPNTLFS